jgi:hypothetical protein
MFASGASPAISVGAGILSAFVSTSMHVASAQELAFCDDMIEIEIHGPVLDCDIIDGSLEADNTLLKETIAMLETEKAELNETITMLEAQMANMSSPEEVDAVILA